MHALARSLIILAILISGLSLVQANDAEVKALSAQDEAFVDALFADFVGDRPGTAVMIAKGNDLLLCKAYGLADMGKKTPVTCQTNFRVGSVSKQFTAMAILQLVGRGTLKLDSKLTDIFPDFPEYGEVVTVFHLLTHQSGLPGYGPLGDRTKGKQLSDHDVLSYLKTLDALEFPPSTRFQYSNSAYAVLAEIVAAKAGVPFEDYMDREIFSVAGMQATQHFDPNQEIPNRAFGYEVKEDSIRWNDQSVASAIKGDGSIYTSPRDYFHWHLALNNEALVSPQMHAAAYTAQKGTDSKYGFGWYMPEKSSMAFVQHGGSTAGFLTYTARIPERKITVAIFTNRGRVDTGLPGQDLAIRAEALLSIATNREFPMPPVEEFK